MTIPFVMHVGCPIAAINGAYITINDRPMTTFLKQNDQNSSFVTIQYESFTVSPPFACTINSKYENIDILNYVD